MLSALLTGLTGAPAFAVGRAHESTHYAVLAAQLHVVYRMNDFKQW